MKRTLTSMGVLVSLAWVAGCGGDPDPVASSPTAGPSVSASASASPSETPPTPEQEAEALKQANIEAAKARVVEYYAVGTEVVRSGYQDWEARLGPFWGMPNVYPEMAESHAKSAAQGLSATGEIVVVSQEVTGYVEDPTGMGNEQVAIDVCVDRTNLNVLGPDGVPLQFPEGHLFRKVNQVVMHRMGPGETWVIGEFHLTDWPC